MKSYNIPTFLTLVRLFFSPIVLPLVLVYLLPYNIWWLNLLLALFFALLSLTDFFDGYLARKYQQESVLGRVLDPLADKFLTYCALIGLLAAHKIFFYWVVIFIGREFLVVGLRQIALEHHFSIAVSRLSKVKTALLMLTITVIIVNPYHGYADTLVAQLWNGIEGLLLGASLLLSLVTAYYYYQHCMRQLKKSSMMNTYSEGDRYG
jgi:CDP-diacylglycerol--glycerol-3-phosphate 3-phosphatidyltransferase